MSNTPTKKEWELHNMRAEMAAMKMELKITKAANTEYQTLIEKVIKYKALFSHLPECELRSQTAIWPRKCDCGAAEMIEELGL